VTRWLTGQFSVTGCTQHATELSVKDDVIVCPKLAYSFATHPKVCTFSSQKEYILLGRSISKRIGTQHTFPSSKQTDLFYTTLLLNTKDTNAHAPPSGVYDTKVTANTVIKSWNSHMIMSVCFLTNQSRAALREAETDSSNEAML